MYKEIINLIRGNLSNKSIKISIDRFFDYKA